MMIWDQKKFKCLSIEGVVSFVSVRITVYHGGCDTLRCYGLMAYGKIHVRYDVDTYMIHNDTHWYTSDTLLICMWYTLTPSRTPTRKWCATQRTRETPTLCNVQHMMRKITGEKYCLLPGTLPPWVRTRPCAIVCHSMIQCDIVWYILIQTWYHLVPDVYQMIVLGSVVYCDGVVSALH